MIWIDCKRLRQADSGHDPLFGASAKFTRLLMTFQYEQCADSLKCLLALLITAYHGVYAVKPDLIKTNRLRYKIGSAKPPIHTKIKGENHWLFCPCRIDQTPSCQASTKAKAQLLLLLQVSIAYDHHPSRYRTAAPPSWRYAGNGRQ